LATQIAELGLHPAAFKNFCERLAYSGVMSVDAFAEYLMDDPDEIEQGEYEELHHQTIRQHGRLIEKIRGRRLRARRH
jgi:hypothetical protein